MVPRDNGTNGQSVIVSYSHWFYSGSGSSQEEMNEEGPSCSCLYLGHHSLETSSGYSGSLKNNFSKKIKDHKDASSSRLKLVTIVNINGEVTSFKTVRKKYPEKNVKVSRSKTLPSQSSLYRNSLKVTVNGTGCLDFKEVF